jgi:hypothetical protein
MEQMAYAFATMFGFAAVTVGMFGFIPFAVLLIAVIGTALLGYRRGDYVERGNAWLLVSLPAIWIFIGLWGGWWWRHNNTPPNPEWMLDVVRVFVLLEFAAAIVLVWWLQGIRPLVAAVSLLNVYFTLSIAFLAGMAISGTWL